MDPLITVIVPVYNSRCYLTECLDSLKEQTFKDFEIILIDDGSTDGSGTICDQFCQSITESPENQPSCMVIHQQNRGQASARNRGIETAKGEWISFVDSDDMIHPCFLETLYQGVCSERSDIALCRPVFDSQQMAVEKNFDPVSWQTYNIDENYFTALYRNEWENGACKNEVVWGKLIRTTIPQRRPFSEGHIYEDSAVMCRWLDMAGRVAESDYPLYFYRDNPHGTVNSPFSVKKLDRLWSLNEIEAFYRGKGYWEMVKKAQADYCFFARQMEKECSGHAEFNMLRKDLVRKRKIKVIKALFDRDRTWKQKLSLLMEYGA